MISSEVVRRYPFFAGFTPAQIDKLSLAADFLSVEEGHYFFLDGEMINTFYLVVDGAVAIYIDVTDKGVEQPLSGQIMGDLISSEVIVSSVGAGQIFGWSALISPHVATAGAKTIEPSQVIEFDCEKLRPMLEDECRFEHLLTMKAAQVVRERLRDMRIMSLAELAL